MTTQPTIKKDDIYYVSKEIRLVYLGEGFARGEFFIPERDWQDGGGKLTNSGRGEWQEIPYRCPNPLKLTDTQLNLWTQSIKTL
jgi:hypothetical protein